MNNKEAKEIALSISVLLDSIFNEDHNSEEVANTAIDAARDIIKRNPKVAEWVEAFYDWDPDAPDSKNRRKNYLTLLRFLKG